MTPPADPPRGATGDHTDRGVPHGATSLTPYIGVPRAGEAADFYVDVLGARVVDRTEAGGRTIHVHLDLGDGHLHLEEPDPRRGLAGPPAEGAPSYTLGWYCEDVDATVERAVAAGATVLAPAVDFVSGDRFAAVLDPFGVRWSIMSRTEDLSEAESAARVADWARRERAGS